MVESLSSSTQDITNRSTLVVEAPPATRAFPATLSWRQVIDRLFPISNARGEIPAMDGLRAIAVSCVFLFHVWGSAPPRTNTVGPIHTEFLSTFGQMGVILFFVLSGFLLFLPYARALATGATQLPSALGFYKRRAMRILPAYLTAVILISFVVNPGWLWPRRLGHVLGHLTFTYTFSPDTMHSLNGVFWSLGIEVQFYVLLPFLAWAVMRAGKRMGAGRALAILIGIILAISLIWRWYFAVALHPAIDNWKGDFVFYLEQLPSLLIIFAFGMGASYLWTRYGVLLEGRRNPLLSPGPWRTALGALVLLVGLAAVVFAASLWPVTFWVPAAQRGLVSRVGWDLAAGGGWAAVVVGVMFGPPIARRLLSLWPLRALALISYSFYIWHNVIIQGLADYIKEQYAGPALVPLIAVVVFPLAFVFALGYFHFVEYPYLRRKTSAVTATTPAP